MVKVVGVRFRNAGKIYYFGPGKLDIHAGMHVIVETARGVEMGTVMTEPKGVSEEEVIQPLKPVIRIATEADENTRLTIISCCFTSRRTEESISVSW